MPHIRINLPELLARKRWRMADLHRETGIAYSSIHALGNERNKRIDLRHLALICCALDCRPGDLLEYVPDGADG